MRIIPDQLRSKNLVPFKKRQGRYKIPGMTSENEVLMDRVDPDLSQEEQSYIRHYLGYADALIKGAEENAPAEANEASPPERPSSSAPSIEGRTEQPLQQPSKETPNAGLINESNPVAKDDSARAA